MNFQKPEKSEFWKNEKILLEMSSFYTCTKNHNHMRYSSWDTEGKNFVWSFWVIFCPLSQPPIPPNNPENQNFEKKWTKHLEMSSLKLAQQKTRPNKWCMIIQIWCVTNMFCHFRPFFALLPHYPPNNLENQHFKKMKKPGDIILHMSTISNINQNHIMYDSWNIHGTWQTEFLLILDHFLPFYTSPLPP